MIIHESEANKVYYVLGNITNISRTNYNKSKHYKNIDVLYGTAVHEIHTRWLGCIETKLMLDYVFVKKALV